MLRRLERKLRRDRPPDGSENANVNSNIKAATDEQRVRRVEHFPVGVKTLFSSPSSFVDIVFVHGLTGDRERTWASRDGEPWPSTLLPTELPTTRILTFGYDARVIDIAGVVSENLIANHAMNLITSLTTYREKDKTNARPIIFVCHSLGGLVCQDALVQARQRPELHLRQVYYCCRGVLFLGTPHRGSGLAKWGELLAHALGLVKQTNSRILEVLRRDSEVLERVQDSFFAMIRSRPTEKLAPIEITCFYEELPVPGVGLIVPRESAALPGYIPISIHQNHMDMTKFTDEEDPGFKAVTGELRRWIDMLRECTLAERSVDSPHSLTASERGFLVKIGPRRYIDIQDRVEGTCVWSTETVQYRSWAQSSQSSILWITGGAGTGKTTLANYLVEHINQEFNIHPSSLGLCSFFCSRDTEGQHDVNSVLQDLVLQLVEHDIQVLRQIKVAYGTAKQDYSWPFETLWRMFENVIKLSPRQRIYIVIDALDECDDNLSSRLLQKLARLLDSMASDPQANVKRIKFIISGQPQIRKAWNSRKSSIDHHHIDVEDPVLVAKDVLLFVEEKVGDLTREGFFSEDAGRYLANAITSRSENSFLWLTIVFQHIKTSLYYRQASLEDLLSQVPQNLQQTYCKYLPHVDEKDIPFLQCYLQLLVASSRSLKLAEIDILGLLQDKKAPPSLSIAPENEDIVKASLQRALGPLIRFPQGTAQFVHSTAKDFFVLLTQQPVHHLHRTHGTNLAQAHLFCFRSCAAYLVHESVPKDLFDAARRNSSSTHVESPLSDRQPPDEDDIMTHLFDLEEVHFLQDEAFTEAEVCTGIRQRWRAYDYAATNWAYHYAHCQALADDDDIDMAIDLLSPASGHLNNWYRYFSQQSHLQMPSLLDAKPAVLSAMFNLTNHMRVLYQASQCRLASQEMSSALYWAVTRGSVGAVKLLLEYGAPVSSEPGRRVPLAVAAQGNHAEICHYLLSAVDMDPNQADHHGKPPLALAAESNFVGILRLLLSHPSIDVNCPDIGGRTALAAACCNGSIDSVHLLRQDGRADVNQTDMGGQSPLHHASKIGDLAVISQLTSFTSITLGAEDNNGRNAISFAAQEGHLDVVKALHRGKVNAASTDRNGRNALSWAANSSKATVSVNSRNESVLEYLVRKFPNEADTPDESGWSPLAWALDAPGYVRSVLILTKCPLVDVNRQDQTFGRCILAWAASAGMTDIVGCLLRKSELEVDQPSFSGQTALSYAAANGMIDTVRLLLQVGRASPSRLDHEGRSPAKWAEMNGFEDIATLLRTAARQAN